jgi:hypothetical protein
MGMLLTACGLTALVLGSWRSYAVACDALGPIVHDGEPTRTRVEAAWPIYKRSRVRRFVRRVFVSVGWLSVAMYGLFLLTIGVGLS